MTPGKHQRNKQRRQDLCLKVHDRAQSFVCIHTLCMITKPKSFYWFVPQSAVNTYCVLSTVKAENVNKSTTNIVGFHNHSPLLTMVRAIF